MLFIATHILKNNNHSTFCALTRNGIVLATAPRHLAYSIDSKGWIVNRKGEKQYHAELIPLTTPVTFGL